MNLLMTFIQKAIGQGVAILFGATGEIVTEKSGNLNLGIPGIMYMGGISGLMGAFGAALYAQEKSTGTSTLLNPQQLQFLINDPLGRIVLGYCTLSMAAGILIIQRMSRLSE